MSKNSFGAKRQLAVGGPGDGQDDLIPAQLSDGDFIFPALQPGAYTIAVEQPGFRPYRKTGNQLSAAERLSAQFPLITVRGGLPRESDECGALSNHGYLGREEPTARAIRAWILGQPFPREIN